MSPDFPDETRFERRLERAVDRAVTPRGAAAVIASATIVITVASGLLMTVVERERIPVDRRRALVGHPDDDDRRVWRQRSDDCPRTVCCRARHVLWDRFPDRDHGRNHEHVRIQRQRAARAEESETETPWRIIPSARRASRAHRDGAVQLVLRGGRPPLPSRRRRTISVGSTSGLVESKPRSPARRSARRCSPRGWRRRRTSCHPYEESRPVHFHHGSARAGSVGSGPTENDKEGWFQHMTTYDHSPGSRWLTATGALLLAIAVLAVAGCSDDTPAVCDSLETLSSDVAGCRTSASRTAKQP